MNKEIELHSGYKIIEFKELDSTMITLKELAITGCDVNTAVWAKKQISGRGRHGREWTSPYGNLYVSFLREVENKNSKNIFAPVFIVALAIVNSIKDISGDKIIPRIKWPNDVLINKSKVAGILIENISLSNNNVLNIGFGINIVSNPNNTIYPTTNLNKEGIQTNSKEMITIFFKNLKLLEKLYIREGINKIYKMWGVFGHKIGDPISVNIGKNKIFGKFNGLNGEGGLLIIDGEGKEQVVLAGDVFLL
ncbi:MAG: biotin--[acetyl-CoA-carboxylase] ligase [Pelagibacterales bacterium]|nr:biotin--[acetyl-CoA-carboxylase] ligase [Pelagibacterales bacterium]